MSKVQDIFGAAPKSVLNKPLFHAQDQKPTGTDGGSIALGDNVRVLNTVLINEIAGSSLSANAITLPAGEYYVEAMATTFHTAGNGYTRLTLRKVGGAELIAGLNTRCSTNGEQNNAVLSGRIVLSATTQVELNHKSNRAQTTNGLGVDAELGDTEVYTDIRIWKLDSDIETPVISDPTMTLVRPLFHVQDQKAEGTAGGDRVVGDNIRDLNTVLTNEIPGASLAANQITLPAGEYDIDVKTVVSTINDSNKSQTVVQVAGGAVLLRGMSMFVVQGVSSQTERTTDTHHVAGRISLAAQTTIEVNSICDDARTGSGLGGAASAGGHELYTDVRIWQLDAVRRAPVLVNDKLFPLPGNVIVTGNMHGLEYEYTAPNNITVQAGICMDSTNETVLTLTNPQLVTIPGGIDTVYNLFLTDDGQQVKTDTDVDGANLPAQDKRRWIGFVTTDGSGNVRQFNVVGNVFQFDSDSVVRSGVGTSATIVDASSVVPPSRVIDTTWKLAVNTTSADNVGRLFRVAADGLTTTDAVIVAATASGRNIVVESILAGVVCGASVSVSTGDVSVTSVRMKR